MKNIITILSFSILLFLLACSTGEDTSKSEQKTDISTNVGEKTGELSGNYKCSIDLGDMIFEHSILFKSENGKLKALYALDGFQTMTRINCDVRVIDKTIDLLFDSYGEEDMFKPEKKKGDKIATYTIVDSKSILDETGNTYKLSN